MAIFFGVLAAVTLVTAVIWLVIRTGRRSARKPLAGSTRSLSAEELKADRRRADWERPPL
jgi:hypothetical protein